MAYADIILATTGLVNYYKLAETTGTTALDSHGSTNLDYAGSFTLNQPGPVALGPFVTLSGTSGYIHGALDVALSPSSMSVELWFQRSDTTSTGTQSLFAVGSNASGAQKGYGVSLNFGVGATDGRVKMIIYGFGSVGTPHNIQDTAWHHLVLTYDGTNWKIFNNGALFDSGTTAIGTGANTFFIGNDGASDFFRGGIAHVATYDHVLDSGTIFAHYTAGAAAIYAVSATTSFVVTAAAVGFVPMNRVVSAATGFVVSAGLNTVGLPRSASASSAFTMSCAASEFFVGSHFVSASSAFALSGPASGSRDMRLFAATAFHLYAPCGAYSSPIFLSAATSLLMADSASCTSPGPRPVSASSALRVSASAAGFTVGDKPVSATTALSMSALSGLGGLPLHVSASSGVVLSSSISLHRLAVYAVSASNAVLLSSIPSFTADRVVSATTPFAVSSGSGQSRDIFVSASTGLGLAVSQKSNNFYRLAGSNSVILVTAAGVTVTGTLAHTSFRLADHARAVVAFPWRRAPLSFPPGGGLPHS